MSTGIGFRELLAIAFGPGGEVLGERIVGALLVPENADDPPPPAVVGQLKTVDAAGEGSFGGGVAEFVAAGDVSDIAEGLDAIDDGAFEESVLREIVARALDIFIDAAGAKSIEVSPDFMSSTPGPRATSPSRRKPPKPIARGKTVSR